MWACWLFFLLLLLLLLKIAGCFFVGVFLRGAAFGLCVCVCMCFKLLLLFTYLFLCLFVLLINIPTSDTLNTIHVRFYL